VQLMSVENTSHGEVQRDACVACCASFPLSPVDINPVVVSLLFNATEDLIAIGGVDGCSLARAKELNAWAEKCLPLLEPDESDMPPLPTLVDADEASQVELSNWLPLPELTLTSSGANEWAVGVTTAPRRLATLDACLDSVIQAGWSDVRLFMDDRVEVADSHASLPCSVREPKLGAWPNYYVSLTELVMRHPNATAYMLVQDDSLFFGHPGLRSYLDTLVWPVEGPAMMSLFCPRYYTQANRGWQVMDGPWFCCALAFVFSRQAVQLLLADPVVLQHRWSPHFGGGTHGIDVIIGRWADRKGVPVYYPSPSLVQHIGEVSSIWETARVTGPRRADSFLGDVNRSGIFNE
jgi:hypothetical protein